MNGKATLNAKDELQALRTLYMERKASIQARLREFTAVPLSEYFYELVYCLMTPQSSAEHADRAVAALRAMDFEHQEIDPEPILREKSHYIRFHKTKSKHLLRAKEEFGEIAEALQNETPASELREWLVERVMGIGFKEATHFLRNIGRNDGLTILDRHILRNLKRYGVIRSLPQSLSRKQYFSIEKKFRAFAERIGIPVDELDLLFWSMETGEIRK